MSMGQLTRAELEKVAERLRRLFSQDGWQRPAGSLLLEKVL